MSVDKSLIIAKLNSSRAALLPVLEGLDDAQWETAVQSEDAAWTVSDLVRHLVSAENGMTGLIVQFKRGKDPVPPDFDRDRYNNRAVEKTKDLNRTDLLNAMMQNRENLLGVIETLSEEDWHKKGRHASLNIYTIEEVCHIIADHETLHLADLQAAFS